MIKYKTYNQNTANQRKNIKCAIRAIFEKRLLVFIPKNPTIKFKGKKIEESMLKR